MKDDKILKSRSGVYQNTSENRRLHRVGQRYGSPKKEEVKSPRENLGEDVDYEKLINDENREWNKYVSSHYKNLNEIYRKYNPMTSELRREAMNYIDSDREKFFNLRRKVENLEKEMEDKISELNKEFDERKSRHNGVVESLKKQQKEAYQRKKESYKKKYQEQNKKVELIPEDNFTRVKFDDMPDSGKVNLKKYLSDKIKSNADNIFNAIRDLPTNELKEREAGLVKNFNDTFDSSKKSVRAFNLYLIMKVKNELARRGNENKNDPNEGYEMFVELTGIQRGTPMTFDEANQMRANPNFNLGGQYRVNCQCCVVNYEMRRRGFDVHAIGNTEEKTSYATLLSRNSALAYIDPNTGGRPKASYASPYENNSYEGRKSYKNFIKNFNDITKEAGRYEFSFGWKRSNSGHIVTAERFEDGSLRIYDPQTGKINDMEELFKAISMKYHIKIMRVDNLDIDQEFVSHIVLPNKEE